MLTLVWVADIEDSAILGMEFLSDVDGKIDLVQQQLVLNGEEIDLCSESCQQLSLMMCNPASCYNRAAL